MPIPGVVGPVPKAEAEAALRKIASNPRVGYEMLSDLRAAVQAVGRAAGAAAATGGGEAEIIAAEDAGEVVVSMLGWAVVLAALLFIVALRLCEAMFVHLASLIPFKGDAAANVVRGYFRWLDNMENSLIQYLLDQMVHLVKDVGRLVLIVLELNGIDLSRNYRVSGASGAGYATQAEADRLQTQINTINAEIRSIDYRISPIGTPLGGSAPATYPGTSTSTQPATYTVKVPQNLWDQIHHVEYQNWLLHKDMVAMDGRMKKVEVESQSLQRSFDDLSKQVHAVRAIATGWQDIENELERLGTAVSHFISTSTAELNSQHRSLVQLAPLGLLLQPGLRGLKTLRQLEDTPCMCPKLPNIPRLQPELLAMYEFLTYG